MGEVQDKLNELVSKISTELEGIASDITALKAKIGEGGLTVADIEAALGPIADRVTALNAETPGEGTGTAESPTT